MGGEGVRTNSFFDRSTGSAGIGESNSRVLSTTQIPVETIENPIEARVSCLANLHNVICFGEANTGELDGRFNAQVHV